MNTQEKIGAALMALAMVGYFVWRAFFAPPPPAPPPPQKVATVTAPAAAGEAAVSPRPADAPPVLQAASRPPEKEVVLKTDELEITVSSRGGVIKEAVLRGYREKPEADSAPISWDFSEMPALALTLPGLLAPDADYEVLEESAQSVQWVAKVNDAQRILRTIRLEPDYSVVVTDAIQNLTSADLSLSGATLSAGVITLGKEAGDIVAADTFSARGKGPEYWGGKLNGFFGGASSSSGFLGMGCGGCAGAPPSAGLPLQASHEVSGSQRWLALKDRFFTQVLIPGGSENAGARITAFRDPKNARLAVSRVAGELLFADEVVPANGTIERTATFYIGPKKLATLKKFGVEDVMEFGFFSWFCKLLVPTLNFFYGVIPNYGIAIILLTFLVRTLFWPLTHKSTVSMKKMQVVQPLIKEIQAKYKDNPQKLQQETWAVYREHKVNPLASCLPILLQIPVFIALFTVLRSAVELRYAPFLWITDLSQPENLFKGIIPLGLNIWPILMAITMGVQSWLQPGTGDPAQKKMMMWMMPIMMLVMFYSMPSALCLYWTVSQVLSIFQMLWIQRTARKQA